MKWRLVAMGASLVPIVIIAIQFEIGIDDVLAVGATGYALAILALFGKFAFQGAKFAYIARTYIGKVDSLTSLMGVRVGSEFIKFTTPMFVGAELVVIYWLHKKGVAASKASWVAIMDIVTEVIAGGVLSMIAGVIALTMGAYTIAAIVLGTSVTITGLWIVLFFLSSKRIFGVPRGIVRIAKAIAGARADKYVEKSNEWMREVCEMSRQHLGDAKTRRVFGVSLAMSFASWIMYGVSFAAITAGLAYTIGLFDSTMAVMAANAVGNLPITVGGSGLVEIGAAAYLDTIGSEAWIMLGESLEWSTVIGWRIATYYIPIAVTWALLMKFALGKYAKVEST